MNFIIGFIAGGCFGLAAFNGFMGNLNVALGALALGCLFAFITLLISE